MAPPLLLLLTVELYKRGLLGSIVKADNDLPCPESEPFCIQVKMVRLQRLIIFKQIARSALSLRFARNERSYGLVTRILLEPDLRTCITNEMPASVGQPENDRDGGSRLEILEQA